MKKKMSILLALCMLLSVTGCAGNEKEQSTAQKSSQVEVNSQESQSTDVLSKEESKYPDYLNLDGYYPIVNEGEEVTLKIILVDNASFSDEPEERFFWKLVEERMNINLEIEQIDSTGATEYINMLFASDNLPDILMTSSRLSTQQLVTYGMQESQLLDLSQYMDADLMPALNSLFEKFPSAKGNMTLENGGIYSYIQIADPEASSLYERREIDASLVEATGLEMPATLDEFVDVLYAMKELDENIIPLCGAFDYYNPTKILLNAYGYNVSPSDGAADFTVGLRDGKAVIPAADREVYGEYLKLMKQFFDDGIIHRDFYTLDYDGVKALTKSEETRFGVYASHYSEPIGWENFTAVPALTSDFSDEAVITRKGMYTVGGVVVSSKTKYPEVVARLMDYLYTNEGGYLFTQGPCETQTDFLTVKEGISGWTLSESNSFVYPDAKKGSYENDNDYLLKEIKGSYAAIGSKGGLVEYRQEVFGRDEIKSDYDNWTSEINTNSYWRIFTVDTYKSIAQDCYPIVYMDEETSIKASELYSVLSAYMEAETIKFITGVRSLEELDEYFDMVDKLGYPELIGYYQAAYERYQAAQ